MTPQGAHVDIIIPHYKGLEILSACLHSLQRTTYPNATVYVVDNCSQDGSVAEAKRMFPHIIVLSSETNLGYAGGINFGFYQTHSPYAVFLSDDTEHEPNWLEELVSLVEADPRTAAVQPKVLSIKTRYSAEKRFDYAGAAGGRMDKLCYPFAYGRVLFRTEVDAGQYDEVRNIFWASGAAMMVKREAVMKVGSCMDDLFFAHMEEIDLSWRLQIAGFSVLSSPTSVVYHHGGATLGQGVLKTYLNHRNNIAMIIKNKESLSGILLCRFFLEMAAAFFYLLSGNIKQSGAVMKALYWNIKHISVFMKKRREVKNMRVVSDSAIFFGSPFFLLFSKEGWRGLGFMASKKDVDYLIKSKNLSKR